MENIKKDATAKVLAALLALSSGERQVVVVVSLDGCDSCDCGEAAHKGDDAPCRVLVSMIVGEFLFPWCIAVKAVVVEDGADAIKKERIHVGTTR